MNGVVFMRKRKRLMRTISALFISAAVIAGASVNVSASASVTDNTVFLRSSAVANVFYDGESPRFKLKIENPYSVNAYFVVSAKVLDRNDNTLWKNSGAIKVSAGGFRDIGITVSEKLPYGWYRLYVDIVCNNTKVTRISEFVTSVSNTEANMRTTVNYHLGDLPDYPGWEDVDKNVFLGQKAGFSANRDDIRWGYAEVKTGEPKLEKWQNDIIEKELKAGQKSPIYILNIYHPAYTGNLFPHEYSENVCKNHPACLGRTYTLDQQIEAYANFCAAMAEELKGTNPTFELGNEPDLDYARFGTQPKRDVPYDGTDYAKLVKAGYTAIKAVDPDATVISAGMCQMENKPTVDFTKQFLGVDGITNYMDGFAFHPYTYGFADYSDEVEKTDGAFFTALDTAKNLLNSAMQRDGTDGVKIYLTEYGSANADDMKQASGDVRTVVMSMSDLSVERINIYNFIAKGTDLDDAENRFGIVRKNYTTAKAGYAALSYMNKALANTEFKDCLNERIYSGKRKFSAYGFKREGSNASRYTYVLWGHSGKDARLTVNKNGAENSEAAIAETFFGQPTVTVPANSVVTVTDMFGNVLNEDSTYQLSNEPLYVTAEIAGEDNVKFEKEGSEIRISGKASKPGADVTLLVKKENSLVGEYAAIDQGKADGLSEYSFAFELPADGLRYSVYVFDGSTKRLAARNADYYGITMRYFADGSEIKDLNSVSAGDKLSVRLSVSRADGVLDNLSFYASLKSDSTSISQVKADDVKWNGANGTAELELNIDNPSDAFGFYLWTNDMTPITPSAEIKR